MKGFDRRTNLPDDLQAVIPHVIDAGGTRGPQPYVLGQGMLEAVWCASLGEALMRGWVRLVPVEPAEAVEEASPEPPTTGPLGGLLRRLRHLVLWRGEGE